MGKSSGGIRNTRAIETSPKKTKNTGNFNANFYASDRSYTREIAEERMKDAGINIEDVQFKNVSYSNGASFYYENKKTGEQIRVSNHPKTGRSSGDYKNISLNKVSTKPSPFKLRDKVNSGEITFKQYKILTKEYGYTLLVKKDPKNLSK